VYTRARAHKFDPTISEECPVCHCEDTVHHRLHECIVDPNVVPVPPSLLHSLLPRNPPAAPPLRPLEQKAFFYLVHTTGSHVRFEDRELFEADDPITDWYTDGSCIANDTASATAAGAAVTLIRGQPYCGTYAAVGALVPPTAPQTSFFGEYVGIQLACTLSKDSGPCTIHSDSAAALGGISMQQTTGTVSRKRRYDPLWGDLEADTRGISGHAYRKVKAHRCLDQVMFSPEAADLMGNHVADRVAAHVISHFRPRDAGTPAQEARKQWRDFTADCIARVTRVRAALPPIPKWNTGVRFALSRASEVPVEDRHRLSWVTPDRPRCELCFRCFRKPAAWRSRCSGVPTVGPAVLQTATALGHRMALFATAGRTAGLLAICLRCAAYSQQRVGKLNCPCPGHAATRPGPLKRVLRGRHPTDRAAYIQAAVRLWSQGPAADAGPHADEAQEAPAAGVPAGAHGEGDPPAAPACGLQAPLFAEEWDLDALAAWFGDND
jgi:hypothetical protein